MSKTTLVIAFVVSTILGTTALAFKLLGSQVPRLEEPHAAVAVSTESRPSTSVNQNIEVEVITATPMGFEPTSITRERGPFILALHNRSGEKELVLSLYRVSGEPLHEVRLRTGRRTQHQPLDLPSGEYLISEAGHPDWRCRLVISR